MNTTSTHNLRVFNVTKAKEVEMKHIQFSDGAETFAVKDMPDSGNVISIIVSPPKQPLDTMATLMRIAMILDAIEQGHSHSLVVNFIFEYLPFARGDRKFEAGMCTPLDSFLFSLESIVKQYSYTLGSIYVEDAHNVDAITRFYDDVHNSCTMTQRVAQSINKNAVIIAPDKGAVDRATEAAKAAGVGYILATKVRNPETGKIESVELDAASVAGKQAVIVDDICDGGGTFIPLAQALKAAGAKEVVLAVTHMIAAKGLQPLYSAGIDKIWYHQKVCNYF